MSRRRKKKTAAAAEIVEMDPFDPAFQLDEGRRAASLIGTFVGAAARAIVLGPKALDSASPEDEDERGLFLWSMSVGNRGPKPRECDRVQWRTAVHPSSKRFWVDQAKLLCTMRRESPKLLGAYNASQ